MSLYNKQLTFADFLLLDPGVGLLELFDLFFWGVVFSTEASLFTSPPLLISMLSRFFRGLPLFLLGALVEEAPLADCWPLSDAFASVTSPGVRPAELTVLTLLPRNGVSCNSTSDMGDSKPYCNAQNPLRCQVFLQTKFPSQQNTFTSAACTPQEDSPDFSSISVPPSLLE